MGINALKIKIRRQINRTLPPTGLLVLAFLFLPHLSFSQEEKKNIPDGTEGEVLQAGSEDYLKKKKPPNEFEGTYSTLKIGLGYIVDYGAYSQSAVFKQQMDSAGLVFRNKLETRDFRIIMGGVLKTKKTISWKIGFMYDGDQKIWFMRETGLTFGVPKLAGHIFVGRTKEGYSMIKVMNGHSGIAAERQMALDVIPILADGIKYFGFLPKSKIFWNLGYFNNILSTGQSFSTFTWQYVARVGWMPFYNKEKNRFMHIAANLRYGKPLDGKITLKSRPESNPAPQIINTGSFQTDHSSHIGAEFYYSTGKLTIGSEVMMHNFHSKEFEDHKFNGGEVMVSYLFTEAKRPYNTAGSIFGFVPVKKSVFKGGWGEWEAVLKFSSLDLDDGSIHGGKFWRFTPMINWYLSRAVRTEFVYGYGVLDRYNLKGNVQIFQARLQLSLF